MAGHVGGTVVVVPDGHVAQEKGGVVSRGFTGVAQVAICGDYLLFDFFCFSFLEGFEPVFLLFWFFLLVLLSLFESLS